MERAGSDAAPFPPEAPPRRVLIVLLGAIGDVVRALPLAQRLRAAWPGAHISWAVEPAAAPIVEGHAALDQVIRFERRDGVGAFATFLRALRADGPELALDLQRHLKSGFATWWSAAPVRIAFHRQNSREGNWLFSNHHIEPVERLSPKVLQFQRFADYLRVPAVPISFGLTTTAAEQERVAVLLDGVGAPFVALLVGSTWQSRYWLPEPTAALCRALLARGLKVVLIGAAADRPFTDALLAEHPGAVVDFVGRTTLRDVIGLLECATIAVGPDSGPMHIAAAVGTPVVSLWGATSAARSAPWGSEHLVVQGEAPCVPCYRADCPIGQLCMRSITPEAVLRQVELALERAMGTR